MNERRPIGSRVMAGPLWDWDPGMGTVIKHDYWSATWVLVRWDFGGETLVQDKHLRDVETTGDAR